MVRYRRSLADNPDDEFFLTLVTRNRANIFTSEEEYSALGRAWKKALDKAGGELIAWVFLPDHHHILFRMGDRPYAKTAGIVKRKVNRALSPDGGSLWQPRFWEHRIRDEKDRLQHVAYIHYNPVRHGHVASPVEWPYSSFTRYVEMGWESPEWSSGEECDSSGEDFGEST